MFARDMRCGLCPVVMSTIMIMLGVSCGNGDMNSRRSYSRGDIRLDAYWDDDGNIVFERTRSMPQVSRVHVWEDAQPPRPIWNLNHRSGEFSSIRYGDIPSVIIREDGMVLQARQTIPDEGESPRELQEGETVLFSLEYRKAYFPGVLGVASEDWRVAIPAKGERSTGVRVQWR